MASIYAPATNPFIMASAIAYDQRFAIAFVSSSGEGGAKIHRRNWGEMVENVAWTAGISSSTQVREPVAALPRAREIDGAILDLWHDIVFEAAIQAVKVVKGG